jgi:hypothetical protein
MQQRRDTAADWTSANPILLAGEIGLETDTQKFKVGDGVMVWNSLPYWLTGGSGGATIGATFPATPSQGDQHLLTVAPIFKCQLNGSFSNGATTLTVDNVTTGAETDTLVGHHLFLLDGSGKRIDEGQISDTGAANTLNVNAKNWATDGWLDDAWVEVGARHSLWHYAEGRWKCPLIDRVFLNGDTDIVTTSTSWSSTGLLANIIAPTADCQVIISTSLTIYGYLGGTGNRGGIASIVIDDATRYNISFVGAATVYRNLGQAVNTWVLPVASGSLKIDLQWRAYSSGVETLNVSGSYPDQYSRTITVTLEAS